VPVHGPDDALCVILTFRDGVLAAAAHDLVLRVTDFEIDVDPAEPAVRARFGAASLRLVASLRDGHRVAGPGASERQEIERTAAETVLQAGRHPQIRFRSTAVSARADGGYDVTGDLSLAGRTRPVTAEVHRKGDRLVGEVRLHQPDFGIAPYSAMFGAIKVKADVFVRVSIPDPAARRPTPGV